MHLRDADGLVSVDLTVAPAVFVRVPTSLPSPPHPVLAPGARRHTGDRGGGLPVSGHRREPGMGLPAEQVEARPNEPTPRRPARPRAPARNTRALAPRWPDRPQEERHRRRPRRDSAACWSGHGLHCTFRRRKWLCAASGEVAPLHATRVPRNPGEARPVADIRGDVERARELLDKRDAGGGDPGARLMRTTSRSAPPSGRRFKSGGAIDEPLRSTTPDSAAEFGHSPGWPGGTKQTWAGHRVSVGPRSPSRIHAADLG
jgi:hypothetical protein